MAYGCLEELAVVDSAIIVKVHVLGYPEEIILATLVHVVLEELEHANISESVSELLRRQGAIVVRVELFEHASQVSQLILLYFQSCHHRNDRFLED